tara:strand:+ start:3806 stop:4045 length:240 start_codon:yes stop_codon:yes gene_type:complete
LFAGFLTHIQFVYHHRINGTIVLLQEPNRLIDISACLICFAHQSEQEGAIGKCGWLVSMSIYNLIASLKCIFEIVEIQI